MNIEGIFALTGTVLFLFCALDNIRIIREFHSRKSWKYWFGKSYKLVLVSASLAIILNIGCFIFAIIYFFDPVGIMFIWHISWAGSSLLALFTPCAFEIFKNSPGIYIRDAFFIAVCIFSTNWLISHTL